MGRKIGYCRVSTARQGRDGNSLEVQRELLEAAGADVIYEERFTGTTIDRPELDKLLNEIVAGDMLIVTKLDRIARSITKGTELIEKLLNMGVSVNILNLGGVLDNTPASRLIRAVFLAFSEFEHDLILERTSEGKALAKLKEGYHEGRPRKYKQEQIKHALRLLEEYSYSQVADMTGISVSTLKRAKREKAKEEILTGVG